MPKTPVGSPSSSSSTSSTMARATVPFLAGTAVGLLAAILVGRLTRDEGMELIRSVRDLAGESFVREVDLHELEDHAVRGMLEGLDRYSRFYGPEEVAALDRETSGEFRGIGVVFRRPVGAGQVLFPFPGSPAARAGIEVGDTLVEVDGVEVSTMEPGGLQARIQHAGGNSVRLLVRGLTDEERELEVTPERIVDPTIRHMRIVDSERSIGYLAVLSFSHRTPGEFDEAIRFLREEGLRALIVDLRGNPGGILDAAAALANRFVAEGRLVGTRTRRITQVTRARPEEATCVGMPLVVLVDEGSASASEVLAGALQDHCAAVLVGEPTYGKGTVQTITPLEEFRARVKITTATYYTPAWRRIERNGDDPEESGIAPDVYVPLDEDARRTLYSYLSTYSPPPSALAALRAWEEKDGVTLIDPQTLDAQLSAAIELLAHELSEGSSGRGE